MLKDKKIVIIGGSTGIGFTMAKLLLEMGAHVIIGGRSVEKLEYAKKQLASNHLMIKQVDMKDESSLKQLFADIGEFDHLQITASEMGTGEFDKLEIKDAKYIFESKFWGSYNTAKQALSFIRKDGSITFYSGRLGQRPAGKGTSLCSAINSAIEGLGRALAVELAPLRINVLSPGLTNTNIFSNLSSEEKQAFFEKACQASVIKRPAHPEEIARAAIYLMSSNYTTGSTLFIDGGYTLR